MSESKPAIALIAAVARNGVIGHAGRMPWHIAEDMAHFKRVTAGCPVIMGRRTWDSLPERFKPLPGRTNIVVTRNTGWSAAGAHPAASLDDAIALATRQAGERGRIFVIGGAELYAAALPIADELVLTEIEADFDGDTQFPAWDRSAFAETLRERHHSAAPNDFDFSFVTYQRRARAKRPTR